MLNEIIRAFGRLTESSFCFYECDNYITFYLKLLITENNYDIICK